MVTMVVPTYYRHAALVDTMPFLLAVRGVEEIIVVDDASPDGSVEWLRTIEDPRVRVIAMDERSGLCAVRNRGLEEARGDWVVMGEDDCRFPPDYVEVLLRDAEASGADVISAPWLYLTDGEPIEDAVVRSHRDAVDEAPRLDEEQRYTTRPMATTFMPARAMLHRRVFEAQRYDVGFGGNAWREETDYFVRAQRAGFSCWVTPGTQSYQVQRWPGGAHTAPWRYELWTIRNNGRFLRRHGRYLAEQNAFANPVVAQLRFTAKRLRGLFEATTRPIAGRALRRVGLKQ